MIRLDYLSPEDWAQLEQGWPSAYNFLLSKSLTGERRHLQAKLARGLATNWDKKRLTELLFVPDPDVSVIVTPALCATEGQS